MQTNDLIGQLAADLRPVRPLARPLARTAAWLLAAAVYVVLGVLMVAGGLAPGGASTEPIYLWQQGLALATAAAAALAAFASTIPGARRHSLALAAVAVTSWVGAMLLGSARDLQVHGTLGLSTHNDWPCVVTMLVGGGLLWMVMTPMLRRGVPLTPRLTAALSGLAALSVANVVSCLAEPHAFSSIPLVWHGGTIAVGVTLLALVAGQRMHAATV